MRAADTSIFSSPFDAIADKYDDTFTSSTIGQLQRTAVWNELTKKFHPGDRVLDIGCGTGVDACFLAERGIDLVACDSSARMLRVAESRMVGLPRTPGAGSVQLRLLPAEEISRLRNEIPFDGAFSNFGVMNCVQDLAQLSRNVAPLLKPGATLLLCLMGRLCLWEMAWYLVHGSGVKALRRLQRGGAVARLGTDAAVLVQYPRARFMRDVFAPAFRLNTIRGIGVAVPPSYLEGWARRFPGSARLAARADLFLGRCPGIRMLADHVLLQFERTKATL